jgi:hypothetical protein
MASMVFSHSIYIVNADQCAIYVHLMRIYKTFAYQLLPLFKGHWRHSVAVASGYWMTCREICQRFAQEPRK